MMQKCPNRSAAGQDAVRRRGQNRAADGKGFVVCCNQAACAGDFGTDQSWGGGPTIK
jgi:hypothetical protein